MNSSDMRHHPAELGGIRIEPLHAFAVVTIGSGIAYLSHRLKQSNNSAKLLPFQDADVAAPQPQPLPHRTPEKRNQRPDILPCPVVTTPLKFRSYETAADIRPCNPNDLILIDTDHRRRLSQRRHLLTASPQAMYGSVPTGASAVNELYHYLFAHHLPRRFPQSFSVSPSGTYIQNRSTQNTYPIIAPSAPSALRMMGENIDEDFIVLQPDSHSPGNWKVAAFVVCFANGYDMLEKLGHLLGEPQTSDLEHKMGNSLESFLSNLPAGPNHAVQSWSWDVVENADLFKTENNKVFGGAKISEETAVADVCVRAERQTLWKLPNSGAVAFCVKSYITPLSVIKAEGAGKSLARAIESRISTSGAANIGVFGNSVLEFLRA